MEGKEENIINVFIHEKMSFVRIKKSKRFFMVSLTRERRIVAQEISIKMIIQGEF
jgi:hypothetical protein